MAEEEKLPTYEVEFIPVERRLADRRRPKESGKEVPGQERRNRGRRATDGVDAPDSANPESKPDSDAPG